MKRELIIVPPGEAAQGTQRTHMPLSSLSVVSITNNFFSYIINVVMHNRPVSLEQNVPVTHTEKEKKIKIDFITVLTK